MSANYSRTGGHWMPCKRHDEAAWRLAIVLRDGFRCVYCRRDLRSAAPKVITLDHLVLSIQGGSSEATNLVTACRSCNSSRRDQPWIEFAAKFRAVRRIKRLVISETNPELARALLLGLVPERERR
jgi:5-methylcytosine-specific restriction endonuclease McrA